MSTRRSEDLSDLKLTGGSIKLSERLPNSSHSSISKRFYFSKLSSRPSSAFPRLCSGNSQDEILSAKNAQRPFSADFVMPKPLSGKSKETLTDGSFESIYVPVDFQLPSSNLFRELLEEDVEQWGHLEMHGKSISEQSTPTLVSDSERSIKEDMSKSDKQPRNVTTAELKSKNILDEENDAFKTDEDKWAPNNTEQNSSSPRKDQVLDEKYLMTPGLTTKPPLPRKQCPSQALLPSGKDENDPIYDYFAIKYNLDEVTNSQMLLELALHDKKLEELDEESKNVFTGRIAEERQVEITERQELNKEKNGVTFNDQNNKNNSEKDEKSSFNWLEEVNRHNICSKDSETDEYIEGVRKECKKDENLGDTPLLSEIDIKALFRIDVEEKGSEKSDSLKDISPLPPIGKRETDNVPISRKTVKSKSPASKRKQPILKNNNIIKKSVKNEKENKSDKLKFLPTKLNKVSSPKHRQNVLEDNIPTWIEKEGERVRKNRMEFSELIESVEELKSTTETRHHDIPFENTSTNENMKHENYDDIETIIEALENQDKTSQQNIQTMKRIVTSELSNSMILNENEENLLFRKNEETTLDTIKESDRHRSDSECSNLLESSYRSDGRRNRERSCHKDESKSMEIPKSSRSKSDEEGYHSDLSQKKGQYRDLLSYLDEVDKKCHETLEVAKERVHTASKLVLESSGLFDSIPKVEDLVSHTPEELSSFVIDLSLRVKDKTSCITLLQNELSALREKLLNQTKNAESTLRQKMKDQKDETEKIAKRHQKFIDQLMEEKKTLARKCEEMVEEMHNMEDKYVANMKAVEHRHQVEMQKMKDMQAASEKLRRERWIEGRTQRIKEMAVKSIEPEVERMEKRHQEELSNLRMVHKREIEELELRAARKLQEHSENLREQLIEDREKALAHERDVMRLRYEKLVESEERNYQDQRRRLQADHSNRLIECEEREAQAIADKERAVKQAQEEFEEKLQAASRRHANEMKLVKETAVIEMENWKNSFRKQQSTLLTEKEMTIRRECKRERDKEIEMVIEKLESEANKARSQIEQTAENRIKRLKDKYDMEIRDLEMLEKDAQTKYCESRSKILEYEEVIITLRNSIKQLEHQLTEEKFMRSKLESEREGVREEVRKQFEDKVRSLEREAEELRNSADKQLEQLYSRVRVSLARKDELLAELTNDHRALKEKCLYLENMMEQQRKEYMINS